MTDTQSALLLGDPDTRKEAYDGGAPNVVTIDVSDLRAHQAPGTAGTDPSVAGLPDSPPSALALAAGESVCAQVDPAGGQVRVTSVRVAETALSPAAQADPTALTAACVPVDTVGGQARTRHAGKGVGRGRRDGRRHHVPGRRRRS
ncbi:hypothetical protein ACRAWF_27865 [Streptomyces sp. L7]